MEREPFNLVTIIKKIPHLGTPWDSQFAKKENAPSLLGLRHCIPISPRDSKPLSVDEVCSSSCPFRFAWLLRRCSLGLELGFADHPGFPQATCPVSKSLPLPQFPHHNLAVRGGEKGGRGEGGKRSSFENSSFHRIVRDLWCWRHQRRAFLGLKGTDMSPWEKHFLPTPSHPLPVHLCTQTPSEKPEAAPF